MGCVCGHLNGICWLLELGCVFLSLDLYVIHNANFLKDVFSKLTFKKEEKKNTKLGRDVWVKIERIRVTLLIMDKAVIKSTRSISYKRVTAFFLRYY